MSLRRLFGLMALFLLAAPVRADLIVTVGDTNIVAGATGFIDVLIRSTGADNLANVGFEFRITTGSPNRLNFVNPQTDPQLTNPNYVFFGDSLAFTTATPVGTVSNVNVPNDTFIGGDATFSGSDVVVSGDKLLVRLQLTTNTVLPPVPGDTFTVSLILGNPPASPNTFFQDSTFVDVTLSGDSDLEGTVTILQPQQPGSVAIPEPSSLLLGLFASCSLGLFRKRRGKA